MPPLDWPGILNQTLQDSFSILPEAILAVFALTILLTDFLLPAKQKFWNALTALIGVLSSAAFLFELAPQGGLAFDRSISIDPFFIFFAFLILAATFLVILLSVRYLEIQGEQRGEYYALLLFAAVGILFVACGNDLVVLFVALEAMAISFYALAGFLRGDRRSNEAALKFVLMGAFSSAILAYGFSILYGLSGSTNLAVIAQRLAERQMQIAGWDPLATLALVTVAAGALFKMAAAPFHQWAPDVYQGAPTSISAYVSVASLAAGFALLLRLLLTVFWPVRVEWVAILSAVAVISMILGTLAALQQSNVKRLLAYSSIAQAGYILLGVVAAVNPDGSFNAAGLCAAAFYLFVYAFFNIGAFAIIALLQRKGSIGDEIDDLNGLAQRHPAAAILMLIFLLSLAGAPPTAGFLAKLFIFWTLIGTGHYALAALGVLCILPAAYFYFRMIAAMWMRQPDPDSQPDRDLRAELAPRPAFTRAQRLAFGAMALVTLAAGILPEQFLRLANYSLLYPFRN
ncbi:MAG: NADH-quinone oxidoreductase subunit N [Candidatus Acidiferrales bacterium]